MERGIKKSKVKKIKLHALRHSHISLLIEMRFTPVDIAARTGHESIKVLMDYGHMFRINSWIWRISWIRRESIVKAPKFPSYDEAVNRKKKKKKKQNNRL